MKLETKRLLRGPNRWSDGTAVEGIVALVPGEDMRARWTQLEADYPELMARVVSFRFAIVFGGMTIATAVGGIMANVAGVGPVVAVSGLIAVAAGLAGLFVPAVRDA